MNRLSTDAIFTNPQSVVCFKGSQLNSQFKKTLHTHFLLITFILFYAFVGLIAGQLFNTADRITFFLYTKTQGLAVLVCLMAFLSGHAIYIMIFVRPDHLTKVIFNDLRRNYFNLERIMTGLPILIFLPVFISVFTSFKSMIPVINSYSWDFEFAQWDALLHGGVQPWLILHPFLSKPLITTGINFFYNLWFFVMFGVLLWQAFSLRDSHLRMQFFLTFVCCWALLGNLLATVFSSVGPCYYGRATGLVDPFQPLMDYLWLTKESFPVWAIDVQEMLWETYEKSKIGFGSGISAMPSMHVSTVFLFALVGWRTNRALGIAFTIFAILIFIGSVHLGWHYAIDGYAAVIGTWLIWRAVGRLLKQRGISTNV